MKMKISTSLLLMFCVLMFGCSKKRHQKRAEKYLIAHVWKCTSYQNGGVPVEEPCLLNDQFSFFEDGTGKIKYLVPCSPTDEWSFQWSVSEDGKKIFFDHDVKNGFNIKELSDSKLDVEYLSDINHRKVFVPK